MNAVAPSPGGGWLVGQHQARAVVFMCICRPTLTIEKYCGYHDDTSVNLLYAHLGHFVSMLVLL